MQQLMSAAIITYTCDPTTTVHQPDLRVYAILILCSRLRHLLVGIDWVSIIQTGSRPAGSKGRGRGGAKQAAGRPLRCGSCFTCRNKQLKKACLRNKELRDQGLEVPTMASPTRPPLGPFRYATHSKPCHAFLFPNAGLPHLPPFGPLRVCRPTQALLRIPSLNADLPHPPRSWPLQVCHPFQALLRIPFWNAGLPYPAPLTASSGMPSIHSPGLYSVGMLASPTRPPLGPFRYAIHHESCDAFLSGTFCCFELLSPSQACLMPVEGPCKTSRMIQPPKCLNLMMCSYLMMSDTLLDLHEHL